MKRNHSGTWRVQLSASEILEKGKSLVEPFHVMSTKEFQDYVRELYNIDYRRGLDWVNAVRKFGDRAELVEGFNEAIIRRLAAPRLSLETVEQIVADIRNGSIECNYRAVEQAIKRAKQKSKYRQAATALISSPILEPTDLDSMDGLNAMLSYINQRQALAQAQQMELQEKRERLQREVDNINKEEQQLQSAIEKYEKRVQAYNLLISAEEDQPR